MKELDNAISRAELVLEAYRSLNGSTGSDYSHVRDLIIDLLHYVDNKNIGASYELLEIVEDIFSEENVESFTLQLPSDSHEHP